MVNESLLDRLPYAVADCVRYYPDFFAYQLSTQQAYNDCWQEIFDTSQGRFLYADGIAVRRAGWTRYLFERVKSWFGYTDGCRAEVVQLSLRKLAYWGYVKGFHSEDYFKPATALEPAYQLPQALTEELCLAPHSHRSNSLQIKLIQYYRRHQDVFPETPTYQFSPEDEDVLKPPTFKDYFFGYILAYFGYYSNAAEIDPQDEGLTESLLQHGTELQSLPVKNSKFEKKYLAYLIEQVYQHVDVYQVTNALFQSYRHAEFCAERALLIKPHFDLEHKGVYIKVYLRKKEYAKAAHLLCLMGETQPEKALDIAKVHFADSIRIQFIDGQSAFATFYANALVTLAEENLNAYRNFDEDAFKWAGLAMTLDSNVCQRHPFVFIECAIRMQDFDKAAQLLNSLPETEVQKGLPFINKHFQDFDKLKRIHSQSPIGKAYAAQLVSQSQGLSLWGGDAYLKQAILFDESIAAREPVKYFDYYIKNQCWQKAYELKLKNPHVDFTKASKEKLLRVFETQASTQYQQGRRLRCDEKWHDAVALYQSAFEAIQKARDVAPQARYQYYQEEVDDFRRLYAQAMLDSDKALGKISLKRNAGIIQLLEKSTYREKFWFRAWIDALKTHIDALKTRCYVTNYETAKTLASSTLKGFITELMLHLNKLIAALKDPKESLSKEQTLLLAQAYFLKAELIDFFSLSTSADESALSYYNLAREHSPNNPIYLLKYGDALGSVALNKEIQEKAKPMLTNLELTLTDYQHWLKQRWLKPECRRYRLKAAHDYVDTTSALGALFRQWF